MDQVHCRLLGIMALKYSFLGCNRLEGELCNETLFIDTKNIVGPIWCRRNNTQMLMDGAVTCC
jgi:hypothetical protein